MLHKYIYSILYICCMHENMLRTYEVYASNICCVHEIAGCMMTHSGVNHLQDTAALSNDTHKLGSDKENTRKHVNPANALVELGQDRGTRTLMLTLHPSESQPWHPPTSSSSSSSTPYPTSDMRNLLHLCARSKRTIILCLKIDGSNHENSPPSFSLSRARRGREKTTKRRNQTVPGRNRPGTNAWSHDTCAPPRSLRPPPQRRAR